MDKSVEIPFDPKLDLCFERVVAPPPGFLWRGWTDPGLLPAWFCPKPWRVSSCDLDLRPGGAFRTVMEGPEGATFPMTGCYLEIVPERRLVWTVLMGPGYRPMAGDGQGPLMTACITFDPVDGGTRYRAICLHRSEEDRKAHESMGFQEGWGQALDQLLALWNPRA